MGVTCFALSTASNNHGERWHADNREVRNSHGDKTTVSFCSFNGCNRTPIKRCRKCNPTNKVCKIKLGWLSWFQTNTHCDKHFVDASKFCVDHDCNPVKS